eukprot:Rhum_TRINITY_DN15264_c5_g3::Rhum_TRINITY_DN15264_c5_g3_i1::g.149184::m.149184
MNLFFEGGAALISPVGGDSATLQAAAPNAGGGSLPSSPPAGGGGDGGSGGGHHGGDAPRGDRRRRGFGGSGGVGGQRGVADVSRGCRDPAAVDPCAGLRPRQRGRSRREDVCALRRRPERRLRHPAAQEGRRRVGAHARWGQGRRSGDGGARGTGGGGVVGRVDDAGAGARGRGRRTGERRGGGRRGGARRGGAGVAEERGGRAGGAADDRGVADAAVSEPAAVHRAGQEPEGPGGDGDAGGDGGGRGDAAPRRAPHAAELRHAVPRDDVADHAVRHARARAGVLRRPTAQPARAPAARQLLLDAPCAVRRVPQPAPLGAVAGPRDAHVPHGARRGDERLRVPLPAAGASEDAARRLPDNRGQPARPFRLLRLRRR